MKIKTMTVRLSPQLHEDLHYAAEADGVSKNDFICAAIDEYIAKRKPEHEKAAA